METLSEHRCHGGVQGFYRHQSSATGCAMQFAVFQPPSTGEEEAPVVYFLAGLTCTEETATIKAGAQAHAGRLGLVLVMPDTSPRGGDVADEPAAISLFGHPRTHESSTIESQSAETRRAQVRRTNLRSKDSPQPKGRNALRVQPNPSLTADLNRINLSAHDAG